jgi:hypothetical protein
MTNHVVKVNNPVRERANGFEAFNLMSSSRPASTGGNDIGNANTSSFAYREQLVDHVASRLATCTVSPWSIPSHKRGPHTGDAHDLMKVEFERLDASPRDALSMLIPYLSIFMPPVANKVTLQVDWKMSRSVLFECGVARKDSLHSSRYRT